VRAIANLSESRNHIGLGAARLVQVAVTVFRCQSHAPILNTIWQELRDWLTWAGAAWPDPGAAGQARSTTSIWRACRAIAKPHSVGSAGSLPCVVFEGNRVHRSGAFVYRPELRELWCKAA